MKTVDAVCPHCGGALDTAAVLMAGPFRYSEAGGFRVNGTVLAVRASAQTLLGRIMDGRGAPVDVAVLADALGSQATDAVNLIQVQLTFAKKALAALDLAWPVTHQRGGGWYWTGPDVHGG